jgi:DNA-3-methyladenine glycosylase
MPARRFIERAPLPKPKILPEAFFERSALTVARDLIGKYLVRRVDGKTMAYMIVETEAYIGPQDLAAHSSKGLTPRTKVMFGPAGRWYVFFTYGIHWMLNVVTNKEGHAAAVLIRGVDGISGPARLTKALKINKSFNELPAIPKTGLWIEDRGFVVPPQRIRRTPRIGVDYAGEWAKKPYRFVLDKPLDRGKVKGQ